MKDHLALFKAFSDETRLRILFLLATRELCVCELVAVLDMPQGKISRHLSLLKAVGVVTDRRDGTWIYYSLVRERSALEKRLLGYLSSPSIPERARKDRDRLSTLSDRGRICIPRPTYIPVTAAN